MKPHKLILVLITIILTTYACAEPLTLIEQYTMDSNVTFTAPIAGYLIPTYEVNNNLTVEGSLTTSNDYMQGNGSHYLGYPESTRIFNMQNDCDSLSLALNNKTITFWFKTSESAPITYTNALAFIGETLNTNANHFFIYLVNGSPWVEYYSDAYTHYNGSRNFSDDNWHYLQYTRYGDYPTAPAIHTIWVDGILDINATDTADTFMEVQTHESTDKCGIFSKNPPSPINLSFLMDNLKIYNGTMNSSQAELDYIEASVQNEFISNCSSTFSNATIQILNITFWDEESVDTPIRGRLDGTFYIYSPITSANVGNFSIISNNTYDTGICYASNQSILVDANLYLMSDGGFTQRGFLINASLNSTSQDLYLYNRLDTTGISNMKGIVRDTQYNLLQGMYAILQRWYPGEGLWRDVQWDKSDNFGQIFFNVIEETTDYRLRFQEYTTVWTTTEPMKFICSAGSCELTFQISQQVGGVGANFIYNWSYSNETEIGTLVWTDTTGLTHDVRLWVTQQTGGYSTTICDQTTSAASGTMSCDTSAYDGTIMVRVFTSASPWLPAFIEYITKMAGSIKEALDAISPKEGLFWTMGLAMTIGLAGLASPAVVVITTVAGLIVANLLGLTGLLTMTFIMAAGVLALIVSARGKK